MAAFVGNNGFNPLPVVAQPHSIAAKRHFRHFNSIPVKQVNHRKRTLLSTTEQMTIVLHSAVLGKNSLQG